MEPLFFPTPAEWRAWLERHHDSETEVWVGYYKKATGLPSITWSQAVDEALCFGWIDGILKRIDERSHRQRFTPRKPGSNWSRVNVEKVAVLTREGRMTPAGIAAFERRTEARSGVYSYEQRHLAKLDPDQEGEFQANEEAWSFFQAQPPGYRKTAVWWVVSAKREETRRKRLATLIDDSANGRRLRHLTA
jgi:uncharacterized protein YdeI (YjbR/CyaY-like superfamily)